MKIKTRLVLAAALAGVMASASAEVDKQSVKDAFAKAPGAEIPYIASKLVLKAKKADKAETAMEVLRAAVAKKPATCVAVVSFISSLVPEAAPKLAAKAAPAKAGEITVALVKVSKKTKHQSIYNTVVAAVPTLLTSINQMVLAGGANDSKGTITTVNAPIAALKADGSVDQSSTATFPTEAPDAVTAAPGVDPKRYNAP